VKDVRPHRIATLFGEGRVRPPRFLCYGCERRDTGVSWPSHCRSTLELDQLQVRLSALMPYRVAADMLVHLLPIDTRKSPETLRSHTLRAGEQFGDAAVDQRTAATAAITVSLCSTFIRSREDGTRQMEFRVGNVEATAGERQVFAAVAKADTDIVALIRRNLETAGQTEAAKVTAFTDGCPGLRSILADAGVKKPPILDWFHIALRMRHSTQAASGLLTANPGRVKAKAAIVAEVERLRWRIWNGKAKNAQRGIDRPHIVIHAFNGEGDHRTKGVSSCKLWSALHEVDRYLKGQSAWLVNYVERHRAGLRVGTSITEGSASFWSIGA